MVADNTLYELLGVESSATDDEIKKAYRKKAMQHHPDKNPNDPSAHQKFQEMAHAYDVLSDPQMRSVYDRGGLEALQAGSGPGGMTHDDIFETLFGGGFQFGFDFGHGGGGGPGMRSRQNKGEDTVVPLDVTLEDLFNGKTIKMTMEKEIICSVCTGTGARTGHKPKKCSRCDGKGFTFASNSNGRNSIGMQQVMCTDCEGAGVRLKEKDRCKKCKGECTVKEKKRQEINIDRGMGDREKIVLAGEGDQRPGVPPGDVIFALRVAPHAAFQRAGQDLLASVRITLSEALLGFSRVVLTHLDGRGIRVASPRGKVIRPNDAIVVKGEGMPVRNFGAPGATQARGDLFVVFEVEMPDADWLKSVDVSALEKLLPPRKPPMVPAPAVVQDVRYEPTDIAAFGEGDEEGWEDEHSDDDEPECQTQ
ncbi:DnaJ-domain-containing protein [Exidia glandulosa HHB12029]|uniref:DnaJ-domain-containing protein n=1 Tax=Exidia glandulosa HHB12029 TaxID=1314781 RepID=A0A165L775_EXIGL|nr:DnaJ-domain-containing protein [Exidia glandulosa HHB12029]